MLAEVQDHFGFTRGLQAVGFYDMPYHRQFLRNLRAAIHAGKLIAFTGLVGSEKTLLLRQLQADLVAEKRVTVSKSLAVDKNHTSLTKLITAPFYDLMRKSKHPVVLFVDEANDLHRKTLSGLKRLREVMADGVLSIVLAGHPRLRNAFMRPNVERRRSPHMEEVGFRAETPTVCGRFAVFPFEGMAGHQASVIEADAVELLAARLRTPLQVERYLELAFEETHRIGDRAVTTAVVEAMLSRHLDELEPRLTRHGYDVRSVDRSRSPDIADEFRVEPADVRLSARPARPRPHPRADRADARRRVAGVMAPLGWRQSFDGLRINKGNKDLADLSRWHWHAPVMRAVR